MAITTNYITFMNLIHQLIIRNSHIYYQLTNIIRL